MFLWLEKQCWICGYEKALENKLVNLPYLKKKKNKTQHGVHKELTAQQ